MYNHCSLESATADTQSEPTKLSRGEGVWGGVGNDTVTLTMILQRKFCQKRRLHTVPVYCRYHLTFVYSGLPVCSVGFGFRINTKPVTQAVHGNKKIENRAAFSFLIV